MGFVEVFSRLTGLRQTVPEHYLDHPILGRNLDRVPSQRPVEQPESSGAAADTGAKPITSMTVAELHQYAADHGIDLAGAKKKADLMAAIQAAAPADNSSDATETNPTDPSPAPGETGTTQED